ncbi:hypothetical protein U1Q18_009372 [Sarracenia purpurea var. burkii]
MACGFIRRISGALSRDGSCCQEFFSAFGRPSPETDFPPVKDTSSFISLTGVEPSPLLPTLPPPPPLGLLSPLTAIAHRATSATAASFRHYHRLVIVVSRRSLASSPPRSTPSVVATPSAIADFTQNSTPPEGKP